MAEFLVMDSQGWPYGLNLSKNDVQGNHTHSPLYAGGSNDDAGDPGSYFMSSPDEYNGVREMANLRTGVAGAHSHNISVGYSGGNAAFDNRPSFYTLAFVKKIK